MNKEINQRIELIKKGKIPQGYQQTRAGLAPNDWVNGHISDILFNEKRTVPKPQNGYWRIGIRSHAKGTFHEFVENPDEVDMDELYVVKKDDLIINITFAWEHAIALADENDDGLLVSHRFPTYVFKKEQIPYFYLNVFVQNRFKELLALISPGGAGRNRVMSKKDFLQLPCFIPDFEEQQKIAEILMQCDKVIKLCEQEIDELKKLKKAYLRKMFPQKGKNVPELRFAGFTDPWEQRKLGDLALFNPKDELPQEFEYVDLESVVGTEMLSHRTEIKATAPSRAQRLARTGDLFYQTVRPYQKNNYLFEKSDNNYVFSTGYAQMRPFIDGYFLLSLVQDERFVKVVLDNCTGTSYPAINADDLAKIVVTVPSDKDEEEKIGALFRNLDNLITLHQRKLEEQKNQKKSLMQLLLTGIVRVKI